MKWREFLHIPRKHRRTRSKARSEVGSIEGQSRVDLAVPRPTESTPDLRIGASALPTSNPLTPRNQESNGRQTTSSRAIYLTHFSRNTDPYAISDRILPVPGRGQNNLPESSNNTVDSRAMSENKSNWKSTAYATTKLAINLVKESSDAFPPLKSVAGGLSAILSHCEVWTTSCTLPDPRYLQSSQQTMACRQTIEALIPRVNMLAESLSGPVPRGDVKEEERRKTLRW